MKARMMAVGIITVVLLGCSSMPDIQVSGLENLKVTEYRLNPVQVAMTCTKAMGMPAFMAILVVPLACATIVLEEWKCDIYYSSLTAWLSLEHEREHCRGKWHDESLTAYRDAWRNSNQGKKPIYGH
ncbi:MAG: hypothetical protein Q8L52_00560 [bacterium]|nr:hypothetical protein [bacterium]